MTADICVPAYNEAEVIRESLTELAAVLKEIPSVACRIIIADNASTDRTAEEAKSIEGITVLSVPERGKGAALAAAARSSSADLFGFIDADLSADPRDFKKLFEAIAQGADIAIGSRLLDADSVHRGFLRSLSSRCFNLLRKVLVGVSVTDTQCGMKLMNNTGRELLAHSQEKGWFFDIELLARAERAHLKIVEIPVRWEEYRFAGRESKLRLLRDAFGAVSAMMRIRRRLS